MTKTSAHVAFDRFSSVFRVCVVFSMVACRGVVQANQHTCPATGRSMLSLSLSPSETAVGIPIEEKKKKRISATNSLCLTITLCTYKDHDIHVHCSLILLSLPKFTIGNGYEL